MYNKKKQFLLAAVILAAVLFAAPMKAQVTIGELTPPNPDAVLDVRSKGKLGLLLPQVELVATNQPTPMSKNVTGMIVYNTATAGTAPNNVVPGFYYNDGNQWVKLTAKSLATNGLSLTAVNDSVQLGGTLTKKTDINMNGQNLVFKRLAGGTGNVGIGAVAIPRAPLEVQGNSGEDPLILSPVKLASETNTIDGANPTYYNLQISDGGVVRKTPAGGSYTAGNGLTLSGTEMQLGGALTKNTTISAAGNDTLKISAPLAITSGNPGADKVLTSDANGNASWLKLPELIQKTFKMSEDNIDRSYTVTDEDLVRLKITVGTEYTLTLPTDPSVTVGRILYVTNVGGGSMAISPLPANDTYQQIDAGYSLIFLYTGNGKWYVVSGF